LGELVFVGLGLFSELDISLRGLEEIRKADFVYAELYTSLMAGLSLENLRSKVGKEVRVVARRILEDENGEPILQKAEQAKVVFLVPGDPLIATTHIDLRIRAEKRGIETRIVHGASIISAAVGLSGLQNYRFGRSVTVPFPEDGFISETPYSVIAENKARSLHTLCFLDIRAEEQRYMTVREALESLLSMEEEKKQRVVTLESLAVGVARAGAEDVTVKAEKVENLVGLDLGAPPHVLIFPADKLHFMEAEALITLAHAPEWVREMVK
jgi:diphthine synthase